MNGIIRFSIAAGLALACVVPLAAQAKDIKATRSAGAYRVELNLLDAEPFADAAGMPGQGITTGGGMPGHAGMMMVVKGGAPPVQPDAPSHPNHHLVVHVYDKASGKAATNATVAIGYTPLEKDGHAAGPAVPVPVVVMEAMGKGPESTHYGNNVTLPPGAYRVDVTVNGAKTSFRIKV